MSVVIEAGSDVVRDSVEDIKELRSIRAGQHVLVQAVDTGAIYQFTRLKNYTTLDTGILVITHKDNQTLDWNYYTSIGAALRDLSHIKGRLFTGKLVISNVGVL